MMAPTSLLTTARPRGDDRGSEHAALDASKAIALHVTTRPAEGQSILFLHGLTASAASWARVTQAIDGYVCIAPDLLGFGQSPKPETSAYDLAAHCDALEPVVAEAEPVCIVGHSMGAVLALELLRRHPRIPVGVLVSPAVFASREDAREAMVAAPAMHRLTLRSEWAARAMCKTMCALRPIVQPLAPLFARRFPPDVARATQDHTWTSYSRTMTNVVVAGLVPGLMASVGTRVTILHGRSDTTVPLSHVTPLARAARRLEVIAGDHQVLLSDPTRVASLIVQAITEGHAP